MSSKTRVLVVEDEDPLRLALCDALRAEGFEVLEAADGEAGRTPACSKNSASPRRRHSNAWCAKHRMSSSRSTRTRSSSWSAACRSARASCVAISSRNRGSASWSRSA